MKSLLRVSMYFVMSMSHFWDANSAVQTTSSSNASQSPDFAFWRWTNWSCCCWASSGNSTSLTWRFGFALLNSAIVSLRSPEVSLPEQYVTVPLALFIDAGSTDFTPELPLDDPPPEEPPPPLSSPPHAATNTPHASAAHNIKRNLLDTISPSVRVCGLERTLS